jgi:hypothetical protein
MTVLGLAISQGLSSTGEGTRDDTKKAARQKAGEMHDRKLEPQT